MNRLTNKWSTALILLAGVSARLTAQTPAAATSSEAPAEETVKLVEFIVTGTNIPTAADASDVPVMVLGPHDIEETGVNSNILEILRKKIPAFGGRSNAGNSNATNTNQNTAGGSQIALRNLDTLVLINGRRVATSGINGVGGKSFVDVNQIPAAAIERMEVLADGASAIYGSDAIGGVVNIILKSNYQGGEVGGRYAFTNNDGHYSEKSGYVVAGASSHNVNMTVTGSWSKTDPLYQNQRPFIKNNLRSGTTFPGYVAGNYLNPTLNSPSQKNPTGTGATAGSMATLIANGTYIAAGDPSIPLFNVAPFQTILLRQEQRSAVVNLSADLIPKKLTLFGDYMYSNTKNFNQTSSFLGNLRTVTVPAGAPYNPFNTAIAGVIMGTTATPLQTYNDSKGNRVTLGFKGEIINDWNWEVGYTYSENKLNQQMKNEVYAPNLNAAIAGGYDASGNAVAGGAYSKVTSLTTGATVVQPALDPFARSGVNPASIANVYGTELIQTKSKLESYDAKVVGMPFSVPAGKVGLAVGASTRKETLAGTPDQNSYNLSTDPTKHNWAPGTFFDPFSKSRTIDGYFGETRIPITSASWNFPGVHALDLSLAGRAEKYSDAGKSTVPKIGLRWQPLDEQLTIRFTYSKAFTAPTLYAEFGPPSVSLTTADLFFNNLGINDPRLKGVTYYSGNGNNPSLQPSTAISRSLGAVFSPKGVPGLTVTVDYVNVFQKGLPAGVGASAIVASVNNLGSASPYFNTIAVGGMYGQPGASQTLLTSPQGLYNYVVSPGYNKDVYITDHFANSGGVHIESVDFTVEYEKKTSMGRFDIETNGTYLQSFKVQDLPTQAFYEDAGYSTNGKTMSGTLPRYRFYTTLDWSYHSWGATLANTYVPATTDIGNGAIPSVYLQTNPSTQVAYYTSWDAQLSYTVGKNMAANLWSYLRGMRVTLGVNNIFNRMPPYAPNSNPAGSNNNNVDVSTYSPIGRLFFVAANVKF